MSGKFQNHIRIFLLFVFINVGQITFAQVNNSLEKKSSYSQKKSRSFSKKGDYSAITYFYLDSAKYYSDKNPLRAIDFINKAIEQSISEKDKATESSAYLILGNIQQGLKQHDLAIENYKKCLLVYREQKISKYSSIDSGADETTLFNANKQMAFSYLEQPNFTQAESAVKTCFSYSGIEQAEQLSARRILAHIKFRQNKTQESIDILNDVLELEKKSGNIPGAVETKLALGDLYLNTKEDKAIAFYTDAKELSEKNNQPKLALKANEQLAGIFRKQKNVSKELEIRNSNISINTSANSSQGVAKQNIEIGNAYLNTQQPIIAQSYYDKGFSDYKGQSMSLSSTAQTDKLLFTESSDLEQTATAYKLLAEEYLKQKDPAKALDYFNKYAALQDSIKQVRKRELDQALSISNSLGKNQQRVDLLEKERQLSEKSLDILKKDQDLKEEQLDFKNIIIGVLIIVLILVLFAIYSVMRSSAAKRKADQLLALKSLRGQMNPHFIFNALNSVNHYISQNDERKTNRYISDFSKLMRMVMDSSKHSLVPLNEEIEMLSLYLRLEHARFDDKFDFTITISEELTDSDFEIPPMLVQPYLENAIWHGLRYLDSNGSLTLQFEKETTELLVTITDNGIGRNKSLELKTTNQKKKASIGMQNIENRIGIMNDLFDTNIRVEITDAFSGTQNYGTKIKLFIPQQNTLHA